ncbi:MAG: tRNA (N6-isopentenyl adenosine(37)-C2)-methylthiotransferase MiaB [Parcubacteria group bacterium]|nr:tRNA (N6-isopentenyl adenosine(37)-C2)-methylthiotransferase MiaB [Parcubacteria group bacterium]
MRYHIVTYGCQMNKNDSERIAAKLEQAKNKPAQKESLADLIIINICSVRQSAINRVHSKVNKIQKQQPKTKIVLTGCILEKDKKRFKELNIAIWPIIDFKIKAKCQSIRHAFIPIMTGCNNFCAYCAVPYTRGREKSRPAQEIIKEIKSLIKQGYEEITLLGQNVNSYLSPKDKTNFPNLLKMINQLEGKFKINFLTSHPKDMSDQLIKVISQSKKVSKQIHLPVQSGDNQILKKMNRGYTITKYRNLIKKTRQAIPQAEISTDIIVGFPGETQKQFQNTVKLVKQIKFKQIYTSAYSSRPGTAATKLKDDVHSSEKKKRKRIILNMIK